MLLKGINVYFDGEVTFEETERVAAALNKELCQDVEEDGLSIWNDDEWNSPVEDLYKTKANFLEIIKGALGDDAVVLRVKPVLRLKLEAMASFGAA